MPDLYGELQLDALRELANIGSGNAATALSAMLQRPVDINVPQALALPIAEVVERAGPPEQLLTAVALPVVGDLDAVALLLFKEQAAEVLCELLGTEPESELGLSALAEIGNILGSAYIGALAMMTGFAVEPRPPQTTRDMLAAIVSSVLAAYSEDTDIALVLDSALTIQGADCALSFMLASGQDCVSEILGRLGL
jgi:chemotaxis protein CheC